MKIALAQIKIENDREKDLKKAVKLIEEAARRKADLILFPEIQLSPFFPQYSGQDPERYVLDLESKEIEQIRHTCRDNNIYCSPNFYIRENDKNYDMSLLIDNKGNIIGKQKMVHIGSFPNFYEQDYYTPSEEGFNVIKTDIGTIGIVVCFDRHFPESIRTLALKGAEIILIPTANTKEEPSDLFEWELKIQAFQNEIPVVMCNRTGKEDKMEFSGESLAIAPNGDTIIKADDQEQLLIADVELLDEKKKYLPLRRKEMYK